MAQWIAEEDVVFVHPDGRRVLGRIAVAAPVAGEHGFECEAVLEGLERTHTICGATTLQALLLGVRFLGVRLHSAQQRGMRVELPDDADADGDEDESGEDAMAVLFGPLLRRPDDPSSP